MDICRTWSLFGRGDQEQLAWVLSWQHECVRRGFDSVVHLRAVRVRKRLHEHVSVSVMVLHVTSELRYDCLVKSLGFAVHLLVIRHCGEVLDLKEATIRSKELADKLQTVVRKLVRWVPKRVYPMIKKQVRYWSPSRAFRLLVTQEKNTLIILWCF